MVNMLESTFSCYCIAESDDCHHAAQIFDDSGFDMILNVGSVMIIFALQGVCNTTVQTIDCIVCRARCNQQMWDSVARKAEDYRL